MSAAALLAQLVAAGAELSEESGGLRVRAPRPLPPALLGEARQAKPALLRVVSGAWRQDVEGWPGWRIELFMRLAALRMADTPPGLAEQVAYLEALEAPDLGQLDDLEHPGDAPAGFVHRYQTPPERPALPPFRWSTTPPATRPPSPRPPVPLFDAPATPPEPPAGPVHGPREPPWRRAVRLGYRIDAHGSWLETGEASVPPHLARFAAGWEPSEGEREARRAQLAAIEADGAARLGPLRGAAPLSEPSPDVLPERAATWREAYQRRLGAGLDPESAARLTITTHGPRPA